MRAFIVLALGLGCVAVIAQNASDATAQLQAFWVLGVSDTHMSGGKGYFRLPFEVQG